MLKQLMIAAVVGLMLGGTLKAQDAVDLPLASLIPTETDVYFEAKTATLDATLFRLAAVSGRLDSPASAGVMENMVTTAFITNRIIPGFDYAELEPWLGDAVGVAVLGVEDPQNLSYMIAAPVGDAAAYTTFLEKWLVVPDSESRGDALLVTSPSGTGKAMLFDDLAYFMPAGGTVFSESFYDELLTLHESHAGLSTDSDYQHIQEQLTADWLIQGYFSQTAIAALLAVPPVTPSDLTMGYEILTQVTPGESSIEAALLASGWRFTGGLTVSDQDNSLVFDLALSLPAEYEEPPAAAKGDLLKFVPDDAGFILDTSNGVVLDTLIVPLMMQSQGQIQAVYDSIVADLNEAATPTPAPTPTVDELVQQTRLQLEQQFSLSGLTMADVIEQRENELLIALFPGTGLEQLGLPGYTFGMWAEREDLAQSFDTLTTALRAANQSGGTPNDEIVIGQYVVQNVYFENGLTVQYSPLTSRVLFAGIGNNASRITTAAASDIGGVPAQVQAVRDSANLQLDFILYADLRLAGSMNPQSAGWFPLLFTFDTQANGVFKFHLVVYDQA